MTLHLYESIFDILNSKGYLQIEDIFVVTSFIKKAFYRKNLLANLIYFLLIFCGKT